MRRFMIAGLVLLSTSFALAATTGYKVLSEVKIGGEGGWDYLTVDAAARRLYVSHATHVAVVDIDASKVVGDIPDTPGRARHRHRAGAEPRVHQQRPRRTTSRSSI